MQRSDSQPRESKRIRAYGVGMPAALWLERYAVVLWEVFGSTPYVVGSVLQSKREWRDVDVRVILEDEEFERQIGKLTHPRCLNLRWNGLCLAFAELGRRMTRLPIDFQIDQQTDANERFDGPRSALGIPHMLEQTQ